MAKQMFTLRDFSGGINTTRDPRDIQVNEFVYLKGMSVDENGALRPQGTLTAHAGLFSNKTITRLGGGVSATAGKNLGYFESDHDVGKVTGIDAAEVEFFTGGEIPSGTSAVSGIDPAAVQNTELG